ncbi:hypothetical protein J1N09_11985 [Aureitalea sp. L0-47]|uniref:hypothetical protein n=1 Tax=Aureitalea sp. L0-47 TaxID=2816962 RepID=UPI0022373DF8|nr:hypothetical protein [Aureitalea sp. L0-47]MCW5520565.1 hypothetical protein [Aureitalea sp. L0-47]
MNRSAPLRKTLLFSLLFLYTLLSFAQTVRITHPGNLSDSWIYNPNSTDTSYSVYYTSNLNMGQGDDVAQLFLNYLGNTGGIRIGASGAPPSSFYNAYVVDYEYPQYVEAVQEYNRQNNAILSYEEYFKRKYPNNRAPNVQMGEISGRTTIFYADRSDPNHVEYCYFIFLNNNLGVFIRSGVNYIKDKSPLTFRQYQDLMFQHVQELEFELIDAPPPTTTPSSSDNDGIIWVVVIGAVIIASVIGLAKLLTKSKPKKQPEKTKPQPKQQKQKKQQKKQTYYVLQLNQGEFALDLQKPQTLEAKVWRVTEKDKKVVSANISVQNSERALKIMPFTTVGTLNSTLTLLDKPQNNEFKITVFASAAGSNHKAEVLIKASTEKKLVVKTSPNNKRSLRPNLDLKLGCYAKVVDERGDDMPDLTAEIQFKKQSEWLDLSEAVEDDGWKAINIEASDPDANAAVSHPPESVVVSVLMEKVPEDEQILQEDIEIQLLDCKIDTSVDTHDLNFTASGEKTELNFDAFIEGCDGSEPWDFKASYQNDEGEPDTALSLVSVLKVSDTKAKVTLVGPEIIPSEDEQSIQKKLVISAQQKDEEPLERHLYVYVSHEGLYITKGLDKKGELAYLAKGDIQKELEFSLYYLNENTNKLEVDAAALKNLTFELQGDKLVHRNIDQAMQTEFVFDSLVTTIPRARYFYNAPLKFPGFGDVHELLYKVSAPVTETDRPEAFEKILKLKVQTYGIGEKFPKWREAYDNCIKAIYLVPESDQRKQLLELLERHKYKMDIEGMVEFRRKIWSAAHDLMINKRDGYLAIANWHTAIIDTLEWVVWMGDIAFQVVVATYTGSFAGFAASAFKETALTGYKMAIEGKSVDEYIDAQLETYKQMVYSASKGQIVSTRTIEKFYKGSKTKVWAIYAVATFAMAYKRLGSVPEAAKFTARQLRDEAIIRFLQGKVMKQKAQKTADAKAEKLAKKIRKGKGDYEKAGHPPDVSGYTSASMKAIQRIANKLNIKIITRPTNAAARKLLKSGQAVPKKMFVKNKTISELDTYIGAKKGNIGKVGSFHPEFNKKMMKNLSPAKRDAIVKRYKQRHREWQNQKDHIEKYTDAGKLHVEDGVVYSGKKGGKGKPFTGDIDIFDIRGPNGERLTRAQYDRAIKHLVDSGVTNVEHGAHLWWEYMKTGSSKDIKVNKGIYKKIAKGHSKGGEPLVEFEPGSGGGVKIKTIFYKGAA